MLDSWVRYEGQVKQRQQRELADSIISRIERELQNPRVLRQILDQAVLDVESKSTTRLAAGADRRRNRCEEGLRSVLACIEQAR